MKSIYNKYIHLLIVFLIFKANNSYSQSVKEIMLNPINKMQNNFLDKQIAISFRVDTIQYKAAGGIEYTLKLVNKSKDEVALKNPLDFLQTMLINEAGYNVRVPQAQRFKVNSPDKLSYQTFIVKKMILDKQIVDRDSLAKEEITIPSMGNCEINLRIEEILATQNGEPLSNSNTVKLVSGRYKLGITLSLIGKGITSQIFQLAPINIRFN